MIASIGITGQSGTLYSLGGFLLGLSAMLTVAITVWRARTAIKHKTSTTSIDGFVKLVDGLQVALAACEKRDAEKAVRLDKVEGVLRENGFLPRTP